MLFESQLRGAVMLGCSSGSDLRLELVVPLLGFYLGSLQGNPKKELLWSLWVGFGVLSLGFSASKKT